VITLTLLHPLKALPVQHWTFQPTSVIRIGRSTENQVVLYSAVVSRHHVEIRPQGSQWEIVSLGSNGTYVDGKRISKTLATDGMIIRLASSGPKLQIRLDSPEYKAKAEGAERQASSSIHKKDGPKETMIN
jgi:pSer/pThr/pTyr-binding forkhead associated (FHA) protein